MAEQSDKEFVEEIRSLVSKAGAQNHRVIGENEAIKLIEVGGVSVYARSIFIVGTDYDCVLAQSQLNFHIAKNCARILRIADEALAVRYATPAPRKLGWWKR